MDPKDVFSLGLGLSAPWKLVGQRLDTAKQPHELHLEVVADDLSPMSHPPMSRIRSSFEPVWLGSATGRGAEPPSERSVPSRCIAGTLNLA